MNKCKITECAELELYLAVRAFLKGGCWAVFKGLSCLRHCADTQHSKSSWRGLGIPWMWDFVLSFPLKNIYIYPSWAWRIVRIEQGTMVHWLHLSDCFHGLNKTLFGCICVEVLHLQELWDKTCLKDLRNLFITSLYNKNWHLLKFYLG